MITALAATACRAQNCGWARIDHEVSYDESGIWNPTVYRSIAGGLTLAQLGGALWRARTPASARPWQGLDSQIVGAVAAEASKYIFTRARPTQGQQPRLWFQGSGHYSFPSGEATSAAALVTPHVLRYAHDEPLTYGLLLLPLYVGRGASRTRPTGRPTY